MTGTRWSPWHAVAIGLVLDMLTRASSFSLRTPQSPLLADLARGYLPAVLIVGATLITASTICLLGPGWVRVGHWIGLAGHVVGVFGALVYVLSVVAGAILDRSSWSTSGIFTAAAVLHGYLVWRHGRALRGRTAWAPGTSPSPASSPPQQRR